MIKLSYFLIHFILLFQIFFISSCKEDTRKNHLNAKQVSQNAGLPDSSACRELGVPIKIKAGKPSISQFKIPVKNSIQLNYGVAGGYSIMKTYTSEDGLAMDVLSNSFKASDGTLWFGTLGGGVSSYDGQKFITFNKSHGLANNQVFSVCEDKKGNLWFSTTVGGVSCYDGKTFKNYTTEDGLVSNNLFSSAVDFDGKIWFASKDSGVSCFDGKKFINYTVNEGLVSNNAQCLRVDSKNNIWIGAINKGISKFDGSKFRNYTTQDGLPAFSVNTIIEDRSGKIWVGTYGGGIACLEGDRFRIYTEKDGLVSDKIICSYVDETGKIWFGTDGEGVVCYDGKSFINFTVEQGLANNSVFSIVEDNAKRLWFSTYGGGVSRFDGFAITNYTVKQGLPYNNLLGMVEDNLGNLWIGTIANGAVKYDGSSFSNFHPRIGLNGNTISNICKDRKGNIWFGTEDEGVICFDGEKFLEYKVEDGLCSNYILGSYVDSKGNIWFSSIDNGVSCFTGDTFINYSVDQGLLSNMIFCINEDRNGAMWFGSYGSGISCIKGDSVFNFSTKNGLSGDNIFCMTFDHLGNLWVGSDETGISVLKNDQFFYSPGKTFISRFSSTEGLVNNTVTQIIQLPDKRIAIGTNLGLMFIDYPELTSKIKPIRSEVYNISTGYPIKDVNVGQNAMYLSSKNILWISTGSDKTGLVRFDLGAIRQRNSVPIIKIRQLSINNTEIVWNNLLEKQNPNDSVVLAARIVEENLLFNRTLNDVERIEMKNRFNQIEFSDVEPFTYLPRDLILPYKNNNITFTFAAVEPSQPGQIQYKYILEGYDDHWSPPSNSVKVSFGNMNEGEYSFKVQSRFIGNGSIEAQSWSKPIVFSFRVLPPWYRTWWAYLIYVIVFFAALYIVFRWRTSKLRRDKEILEETVIERTSELVFEKKRVEEKNREILSSIEYAKRIQATILPSTRLVKKYLNDSFILYIPKDIVAGDFYWMDSPGVQKIIYFAACDCTGHGVPGAMVSVVCHNALNKALNEFGKRTPAEILDKAAELVIEDFNKNIEGVGEIQDGMDVTLCALDLDSGRLLWAGANNPLWIIRKSGVFEEIKPDKQHVGKTSNRLPFTHHEFHLEKGDLLYLITDGYSDQFGGEFNKKFQKSNLKKLLMEISNQTMDEQRISLYNTFENWKGSQEQIDDITIIGMRYT